MNICQDDEKCLVKQNGCCIHLHILIQVATVEHGVIP